MFKKLGLTLALILTIGFLAACQQEESKGEAQEELFHYTQTAEDIAEWTSMETPGGGEGSVELGDNVAVIQAAPDGWGGVQSAPVTIDLTKDPMLFVQVKENADGFKWGAKFVPTTPEIEDHAWGVYLIEDNNFKWNNYAVSELNVKLDQSFRDMYGDKVEGVIWIYATGSPEATVEVTSVKMLNQK
ncbi:hypothetical protein GCM10008967_04480 [Bacillus carboniphilus]|uniref:Lipoprotein n=1 Tax=Bacillus carboniphilus TaxID=86663 RepID=A0ABN0VTK0_9BACI